MRYFTILHEVLRKNCPDIDTKHFETFRFPVLPLTSSTEPGKDVRLRRSYFITVKWIRRIYCEYVLLNGMLGDLAYETRLVPSLKQTHVTFIG